MSEKKSLVLAIAAFALAIAVVAVLLATRKPRPPRGASVNEVSAAASLRAYLNAQATYHRQDWDGDGVREYAADFVDLFELTDTYGITQQAHLIDRALAEASTSARSPLLAVPVPRSGYLFHDLKGCVKDGKKVDFTTDKGNGSGYIDGFGLLACPGTYGRTGRGKYVVNEEGTVYAKDEGDGRPFDYFPDVSDPKQGWLPVTE